MSPVKKLRKHLPIFIDIFVLAAILLCLAWIRGFSTWLTWGSLFFFGGLLIACIVLFLLLLGVNRGLWRYAGESEYIRLFFAYGAGLLLFSVIDEIIMGDVSSFLFIMAATSASLIGSMFCRLVFRYWRQRRSKADVLEDNIRYLAIIGAGSAGVMLLDEISRRANPYKVWCLVDDDPHKIGSTIHGVPVYGPIDDLPIILKDSPVFDVVMAIPSLDLERRRNIITMCSALHCKFRIMPDTTTIMERSGGSMASSLREVRVEDLLSRTTVTFATNELDELLKDKTVLVTGGGGSIGSELCRQIAKAGMKKLVVFDICENDSYMLYRELKHLLGESLPVDMEIGSIVDKKRVDGLFAKHRPEVVFHAAAHKHVPLMEACPSEAVRNNIFGTYNLLLAAKAWQVKKFVHISTDKAINPTSVMGATKRYCELMVQAMAAEDNCKTDLVAVRFGNVLGSGGSVLPLFQMQIAHGGPVTITDKRVTRYFMTIPEAAGLVIKAAAMAKRSEIFVLDMGEAVKIIDLAENIIRLSGFEPYKEIAITEIGLRPGEKLYEELLINDKNHVSTKEANIFIEYNGKAMSMERLRQEIQQLHAAVDSNDEEQVYAMLQQIVPTFKSSDEVNGAYWRQSEEQRLEEAQAAADAEAEEALRSLSVSGEIALAQQSRGA